MRRSLVAVALLVLPAALAAEFALPGLGEVPLLPNMFPAGFPRVANPMAAEPYVEPPVPANAYRGLYGWTTCSSDMLIRPESTTQLAAAIKDATAKAAAAKRPLKMRATRPAFATMQSFTCAGQPSMVTPFTVNGQQPMVVGIMMDKMDKLLSVDNGKKQLRVQAQMKLKDLYAAADANQMSTPRSALPWWQGLTVGGVFATGSHGTGNNVTSMICDWFVDVTWVSADGQVHVTKKGTDEAAALCGGLGLLGVLTEFTLQLTETTNTHFSTWYVKDDTNLAADVEEMLKITPHLVVMWRPDIGKYTGHMQRPAAPDAVPIPGAACNVIPQQTQALASLTGPQLRAWQGDPFNQEALYYAAFDSQICMLALVGAVGATWVTKPGPGSHLGLPTPVLEGVAATTHITSTECGDNCAFTNKNLAAAALDVEFSIEHSNLAAWIADIKSIIAQDLRGLPGWGAHTRCLSPGYYVMRFGKTPHSLVGNAAGLKQPVYLQQQMLASRATAGKPMRYEWVQEVYEQLTLCKYNGRPHTGKNWDRTFTNPRCPIAPKYGDKFKAMVKMQDKFDPGRVFEPQLWARLAKGEGYKLKPKCQLDRSCYCQADEHCPDGFACVPSIAFPEFMSCRPKVMN